jgi:hypothetical protein
MDQRRSKQPIDPLAETVSDRPAVTRQARGHRPVRLEELRSLQPEQDDPPDLGLGRDLLDDTVAEGDASIPSDDEVQLDRILDRPQAGGSDASLYRYDPEAGHSSVAVKIKAVREAVRNSIATPFGKLMVAVPVFLAGVSLAIAAATLQDWAWIIAAGVVFPTGSVLMYIRYQAWLGHKRYLYRLLETLGEDVSDFDFHKRYRAAKKRR